MLSPICLSVIPPLHVFSLSLFFLRLLFLFNFFNQVKKFRRKKKLLLLKATKQGCLEALGKPRGQFYKLFFFTLGLNSESDTGEVVEESKNSLMLLRHSMTSDCR